MSQLKHQLEHTKNKRFYMNPGGTYLFHMILVAKNYCKLRTEKVFKDYPGDSLVEGSTFGRIIHDGYYSSEQRMFTREPNGYERLYSLDVLGVENRGELTISWMFNGILRAT